MLGFPIETTVGLLDRTRPWRGLAVQWLYVALMLVLALAGLARGHARFVAFGG